MKIFEINVRCSFNTRNHVLILFLVGSATQGIKEKHTASSSPVRKRGLPIFLRTHSGSTHPVASQVFRIRWIWRRLTAVKATISDTGCEPPDASIVYLRSVEIFLPLTMVRSPALPSPQFVGNSRRQIAKDSERKCLAGNPRKPPRPSQTKSLAPRPVRSRMRLQNGAILWVICLGMLG